MPKGIRQRITQRGQVEVSDKTGTSGVPAAIRTSAMSQTRGGSHVSNNSRYAGSGFRALSGVFDELAQRMEQQEAKAEVEARIAQREAQAASKEAEKEAKARSADVDLTSGKLAGLTFARMLNEKADSEGWGYNDALEHFQAAREAVGDSQVWSKGFDSFAFKALENFAMRDSVQQQAEGQNLLNSGIRQGFDDLHSVYDPDTYYQSRQELFDSRDTYGVKGSWINETEFASIENNAQRFASSDPIKAQHLLELAEQKRPDGTPSLAASIPGGYTRLQTLRESINASIVKESKASDIELKQEHAETTKGNYLDALVTIAQLGDPEAVKEWEAENLKGKSNAELEALYGDYRGEILSKVHGFQSNVKPEGNDQALAEWLMKTERGQAEWEDINQDNRLSDGQKAQLYSKLNTLTQQAQKGYLTDAQLAVKLVNDLEQSWPNSVYGTPWTGSRNLEPGKPPVVTPEGSFYQGELLKRLREVDPVLDVNKSNEQKLSIAQEVHDEIISGRLKFNAYDGKVNEPVPELKLSQKVKEGIDLSERDVTTLGKAYNNGGTAKIKDVYGIDLFALNEMEQRRIAGEAQRQKAELEALKSQSFWGDIPNTDEFEMQRLEESRRLTVEAMELNRLLWSGEDIKIDG